MLDIHFIRAHQDAIKQNCRNRNVEVDISAVVRLDDERKKLLQETQQLRQRQNEISKQIPKEKDPDKKQQLIQEGKQLRTDVSKLDKETHRIVADLRDAISIIPNITHPDAPTGNKNKVISTWGKPVYFDFNIKDHVELAQTLDLVDFEAGSRVSGQKFYYLKNDGAMLELALVQYAMNYLASKGFTPVITPDLARVEVLEGIGFIPRGPETQIYSIAHSDLCLIATAEITLGGMHKDKIFLETDLPQRYVGLSHCFRTEAGTGRDTHGLYRVHQFTKVEMFVFCTPQQSELIHQEILGIQKEIFSELGLSYQVIDTATEDLGAPAYRKYDLEAWMPGRGGYGEVTSASNCTDYQARRLNIRYRPSEKKKGTQFVHTLNGTAIASTRAILAILENNQQADGSVVIPEVLQKWMGKKRMGD